ncbi:nuclear transport factor 2 family protein [Telluria antibiotica]|nr:nuclear transport factor 2 family protein [Telluria antibiotica]
MRQRRAASDAFVGGDCGPLGAMSTDRPPATLFGPGGENRFEVLHSAVDGDLAYRAGIQRSVVNVTGQPQPVPMDLRVAEVFRREEGAWKLVHLHADKLAGGH